MVILFGSSVPPSIHPGLCDVKLFLEYIAVIFQLNENPVNIIFNIIEKPPSVLLNFPASLVFFLFVVT